MAVTGTMEITADALGGACVLTVSGEIDLNTVNVFIERLFELSVDGDQKIILDMTDVTFVDSTVINVLFAAAPRIRANGGDMALVVVESIIARALDVTGADAVYRIVRTQRQAFEALGLTPD